MTNRSQAIKFSTNDFPVYTHVFGKMNTPCFHVNHMRGEHVLVQDEQRNQHTVRADKVRKVV